MRSHPELWNYCNILRDDGLPYGDYVEQLIPPLRNCYLKMADEQATPPFNKPSLIPKGKDCRRCWRAALDSLCLASRDIFGQIKTKP